MPLTLSPAHIPHDLSALVSCQWLSFESPPEPLFRLFFPLAPRASPALHSAAMRSSLNFQLAWHNADPSSYWQKVSDDATGEIVGGALWKICETDPFAHEEVGVVDWYPEGLEREFVTKALEQLDAPRRRMGRRPQLYLNILFTHPSHRGRGAATSILQWGIRRAAELKVEIWIEATEMGVPLYRKHGFAVVDECDIQPVRDPGDSHHHPARRDGGDSRPPPARAAGYGCSSHHHHAAQQQQEDAETETENPGSDLRQQPGPGPSHPSSSPSEEGDTWSRLERELLPVRIFTMWRPVGGPYVHGETVRPWEV